LSWFSPKPKTQPPQPAEPPMPAPIEEWITVELLCMKCRDRFEVKLSTQVPRVAPGFCARCQQVVEWMTRGDEYFEFLREEIEATRRKWIIR
jgi:hypothetical protein